MAVRYKLTGFKETADTIQDVLEKSIRTKVRDFVEEYLKQQLRDQVDSSGKQFPEKKEATKKEYRKHNWNTEDYLIRTGESTKLKYKRTKDGFTFEPKNPDILKKFVGDGKIDWMSLNDKAIDDITDILLKELKRKLK